MQGNKTAAIQENGNNKGQIEKRPYNCVNYLLNNSVVSYFVNNKQH